MKKHGVRLGFMSFFTKAVVAALKQFPLLNAEIQDDEIVVKKFYDIGIAVAAPEGLVVPVVREANEKNVCRNRARNRPSRYKKHVTMPLL
ncbi:hypothetical protein GCM10020331_002000 [Ectobacillus funiculus]